MSTYIHQTDSSIEYINSFNITTSSMELIVLLVRNHYYAYFFHKNEVSRDHTSDLFIELLLLNKNIYLKYWFYCVFTLPIKV